jgi:hypothetical protein
MGAVEQTWNDWEQSKVKRHVDHACKPQQQTLSIRVPESLRDFLELAREIITDARGETTSIVAGSVDGIAHRRVSLQPPLVHPRQHKHATIHVIVDLHNLLAVMQAM